MVVNAVEKEHMSPPHMSAVSGEGDDHIIMMMMKHRKILTVMSKCMHSLPIALEKENAILGE